jgi:hypothetical protein
VECRTECSCSGVSGQACSGGSSYLKGLWDFTEDGQLFFAFPPGHPYVKSKFPLQQGPCNNQLALYGPNGAYRAATLNCGDDVCLLLPGLFLTHPDLDANVYRKVLPVVAVVKQDGFFAEVDRRYRQREEL